jgi:hypothetical protein
MLLPVFVFVGGTATAIVLERANVDTWIWVLVGVTSWAAAAFVAWRSRWAAAYRAFVGRETRGAKIVVPTADEWNAVPTVEVYGQIFENDRVKLDGKMFRRCSFTNVAFVFDGSAPFRIIECRFPDGPGNVNTTHLESGHPAIQSFLVFLEELKQLPGVQTTETAIKDSHGMAKPIRLNKTT